ncbi:hypothetical protein [Hymenobacter fodinae]|uniref:Uncharacterized protein n=1 Tax=Hymenobacter fodinae TaxID=2510796 RepID=A0A4Z0P5S2_9BACT|nr:hypothetical protein [Hymenobacter fodinae]TGE07734.1 hypothetical protein EU556_08245 [Hymenobacter fodinae]
MQESYLTGTGAADVAAPVVEANTVYFDFSSVTLTDEFNLTLVGYRHSDDAGDEFTITRHRKPHPELLKCLRRLTLHMCLLTESLTDTQLYPAPAYTQLPPAVAVRNLLRDAVESGEAYVHPLLENYRCTSVIWKPKGVVLKGSKRARYRSLGHSLKVETPVVDVRLSLDADEEPEEWEYPFFEQMRNALDELKTELVAFMNGKYGEGGEQLELFGKDPEPRSALEIAEELIDALDKSKLTMEVTAPGGKTRTVGGRKAASTDPF